MRSQLLPRQAESFRELRKLAREADLALDKVKYDTVDACEHGNRSRPDTCWVCRVYETAAAALKDVNNLRVYVDQALQEGPHPNEGLRTSNGVDDGSDDALTWTEDDDARR